MPRGEDVEIAEPEIFLPFLVALFLVASLAPTFLLFFTRLPSSFENLAAANRQQNTSYPLSTLPWIHPGAVNLDLADHPRVSWNYPDIGFEVDIDLAIVASAVELICKTLYLRRITTPPLALRAHPAGIDRIAQGLRPASRHCECQRDDLQLAFGVGLCRIPGPLRPIEVPQRTLPAAMQAAAEVNQPSGTIDQPRLSKIEQREKSRERRSQGFSATACRPSGSIQNRAAMPAVRFKYGASR
jgi:hypothetical protein